MKTIIHVDNSEFFRKLMKTFFAEQGFVGEFFSHGADALKAINQEDVAVVITGMSLSDMDGDEFIKRVLTSSYKGSIIVLTSNDFEAEQKIVSLTGVKAYIPKSGAWEEALLHHLYQCLNL
ncbi:MAG: response regulator [Treponema sp.]|jgi:two-component system cell cycle response regulator|nr:response regulator [Treponema sp.]